MHELHFNDKRQRSDTIRLGAILALSGGFMDAYTYLVRGHVFANAQTGNMLLLGISLSEGEFQQAFNYCLPIIFFSLGIVIAEMFRDFVRRLHWRQIAVLMEAVIFILVAFIPLKYNLIANALVSFACGIQVESFRKIHGNIVATTMCIGNLRSGTQNVIEYLRTKDDRNKNKAILYFGIIFFFVIGAVIGNLCIKVWNVKAILACVIMQVIAFCIMLKGKDKQTETI